MSPIQIMCLVALDKHQRLATNNSFVIHRRTMVCSSPTTTLNQSSNCYGVVRQPKMNSSLYQTTSIFNLFGQVLLQRSNLSTLMIWAQFPPQLVRWSTKTGFPRSEQRPICSTSNEVTPGIRLIARQNVRVWAGRPTRFICQKRGKSP